MHRHPLRPALCDEQGEVPIPTSGEPAADAVKLTIGQRLSAALASKESLQAKIVEQGTQITEQAAAIETLTAQLAEATAKISQLEADAAEVETALKAAEAEAATLKANAKSADALAKEKIAALGFPAAKLPAANAEIDGASDEEKIAALNKKVEASTDPKEKGQLVLQIRALRQVIGAN